MKLSYNYLTENVDLDISKLCVLIIENIDEYRNLINSLYLGSYLIDLYENEEKLDIKYIEFIEDIYFFDFNNRKIINYIDKEICKLMSDEFFISKTINTKQILKEYFDEIMYETELPLDFEYEIENTNLIKSISVRVKEEWNSAIEKIIDYFELIVNLKNTKVFITKNIELYLSDKELELLIEYLNKRELILLDIERIYNKKDIKNVQKILFDEDMCRII